MWWRPTLALVASLLAPAVIQPRSEPLSVRLDHELSSQSAVVGTQVAMSVIAPFQLPDRRVIPPGSRLFGRVTLVQRHTLEHAAQLGIAFTSLDVGSTSCTLRARLADVDNARETVSGDGVIEGPRTQADSVRGRAELLGLAVLVPELFALDVAQARIREGVRLNIDYPAGTEMSVAVVDPAPLAGCARAATVPVSIDPELGTLLRGAPQRTSVGEPARPGDPINVALVGSARQLREAFTQAGWATADALNARDDAKAVLAILAKEAYRQAPVSLELLGRQPPDLVFQKQSNTFAKRHHIRLWEWSDFGGRAVWIAAATHDIGVKLDVADHSFTHRVEPDVDVEREKVVNDLRLSGAQAGLIERADAPRTLVNATGDAMRSDGRLAIVLLPMTR